MLKSPVGATAQNDVLTEAQLASFLSDVHLADDRQPYFFEEEFKYLHYTTPFFDDGHKRAICNFLVTGQHRDYFLVTINADMTSFTMKTRVSPIFLNIMMWAAGELNRTHPNTMPSLLACARRLISLSRRSVVTLNSISPKGMCTPSHSSVSRMPTGSCCGIRVATNSSMRGGHPETLIYRHSINRLQSCV